MTKQDLYEQELKELKYRYQATVAAKDFQKANDAVHDARVAYETAKIYADEMQTIAGNTLEAFAYWEFIELKYPETKAQDD